MRFNIKQLTAALFAAAMLPTASCTPGLNSTSSFSSVTSCNTKQFLSDLMSDGNYTNFVDVLQNKSDNFLHILRAGDRVSGGDMIDIRNETTPVYSLKATQNEIGLDDSLLFILNPSAATNGVVKDTSAFLMEILTASSSTVLKPQGLNIIIAGNDIIDGHHRWSTVALINPNVKMGTLNIHGAKNAIDALKITQGAILATKGVIPSAGKRGTNMLTMDEREIYDYVKKNISTLVLEDLMFYWKASDPEHVVKALYDIIKHNLGKIKRANVNTQYDISRTHMPQTDREGMWLRALQSGEVNVRTPFGGGRKRSRRRSRYPTSKNRSFWKRRSSRRR